MSKKIFRSSFFTAVLVLISTIVLIMGILFRFFETQIQAGLENEARIVSLALESEGAGFLDKLSDGRNRITLIAKDGAVLYDNRTDVSTLDNHAQREEVKEAMETGKGMSIRYSSTLTEKTVNYAVRLSDSTILRVSANQYTAVTILLGITQPILIILLIALILTLALSVRVSKAIIQPMNALDLESPDSNDTYDELTPLLRKIAEQKQTIEEQLADAHQKQIEFHLITENMSEGFLVIDQDANLLTYNSAALKLLSITPPAEGSVLTLCRTKDFRDVIGKALTGAKAQSAMAQNGRSYSLIANPAFKDGNVIGAVIVILDITEQEKRDTLRREFTANVSHELKTPLTSISGFAELLKDGSVSKDTAADFSKTIYEEAQRLITLVNDIIMISELDGGSVPYQWEPVDLYALSKEILNRLQGHAQKKRIAMHVIGEPAVVIGVRKILDEILYNLCDNAVKYNKENGTVDLVISHTSEQVTVIVRDTGIGIPAEHQSRVFERFYRVDKSHSKKVGGTGLGLSIVKHGVIYHNASLSLDSTEGEGTAVTVHFFNKSDRAALS